MARTHFAPLLLLLTLAGCPDTTGQIGDVAMDAAKDQHVEELRPADVITNDSMELRVEDTPSLDLAEQDSRPADAFPADLEDVTEVVSPGDEPGVSGPIEVEVLLEATYTTPDITIPYQLLKLTAQGAAPTYAQWFPPLPEEGKRPVMLVTRPYDGIDWTDDPVDAKWAARGAGAYPDDDEPSYGTGSSQIGYTPLTHQKAAEEVVIYRLHKMGALFVYGRYYAGGSVWNDVDDMTAGLAFLGQHPAVDTANIGIFGASWGGFEAVYGAAYAPAGAVPKVGVALAPLALMDQQLEYLQQILPQSGISSELLTQYQTFFEPYVRRIYASTGGAPDAAGSDYSFWDADALAQRTTTDFLLIHDEWDTLVPFVQSATLHEKNPQQFHPLFMYQESPRDFNVLPMSHGPMLTLENHFPAIYSIFYSYALTRLLSPSETVWVVFDPASIRLLFESLRQYQLAGKDVSWAAPLLVDLCQPNVTVIDASAATWTTKMGAQLVAEELNAVWGIEVSPADVEELLLGGLPE